jgi:hypothetical protein
MSTLLKIAALALIVAASAYADDWQKMKECAVQADKWEQLNTQAYGAASYRNHYSPKYNHCYVQREVEAHVKYPREGNVLSTELYDIFEENLMAFTQVSALLDDKGVGYIDSKGSVSREEARAYIEDHMAN